MRNSQIMSAMTDMDDDLLLEAAPGACDIAVLKKGRIHRAIMTFAIAYFLNAPNMNNITACFMVSLSERYDLYNVADM